MEAKPSRRSTEAKLQESSSAASSLSSRAIASRSSSLSYVNYLVDLVLPTRPFISLCTTILGVFGKVKWPEASLLFARIVRTCWRRDQEGA